MKNLIYIFIICIATIDVCFGQTGGVKYNSAEATNGYSLLTNSQRTYLIDNCGEIVHDWNVRNVENHCKLLPNGNLLYSKDNAITEIDWDGNIVKRLVVIQNSILLDYEVIPMPNGNYICAGRKPADMDVFKSYGYQNNTSSFVQQDVVIEVDGTTGNIVWQWEILDHVIQDVDPTKLSYGVIKDNPRKLNINAIGTYDWNEIESFMINGIDYNPELDEIALSVRKLSEVVIIDHSTTTAEAKGSTGGKRGHGGDALYRYGNPQNYGRGTVSDRKLYFQHNPNWIKYGVHKGKIMVFNNMLSSNTGYSSVDIFDPLKNADGSYVLEGTGSFQPKVPLKEYNSVKTNTPFFSGYTSGGEVLPNGNISITVGRDGTLLEIDPSGKIRWEYVIPSVYYIFRTTRYPADYMAFVGKELIPSGTLENPSSSYNCKIISRTDEPFDEPITVAVSGDRILLDGIDVPFDYRILNINGQLVQSVNAQNSPEIQIGSSMIRGVYIIQLIKNNHPFNIKLFIP